MVGSQLVNDLAHNCVHGLIAEFIYGNFGFSQLVVSVTEKGDKVLPRLVGGRTTNPLTEIRAEDGLR